ncbi:MAG: outer membrane lipoprotein-sorting protein [Deltaproteobacteria bacterium]|nr:outer membrane lipoprotein-sorting protein [Candidatus Anaeroferrophillacea bacterium]
MKHQLPAVCREMIRGRGRGSMFYWVMAAVVAVVFAAGIAGAAAGDAGAAANNAGAAGAGDADAAAAGDNLTGEQLARLVYDRDVGRDSHAEAAMILIDHRGGRRERLMIVDTMMTGDGLRRALIRFTEPPDIAGTGFLTLEEGGGETTQYLYLPALRRTRRIVTSQKGRPFVNSDFFYEDLERRPVEQFDHRLSGAAAVDGVACLILESTPKSGVKSAYRMVRRWVARDRWVIMRAEHFDRGEKPLKTYTVETCRRVDGIWTEMRVRMRHEKDDHETVLEIRSIVYNRGVGEDRFTTRELESW